MPPNAVSDQTLIYRIPTIKVQVNDRNGNNAEYIYGGARNLLEYREFTSGFRATEPTEYLHQFPYNKDRMLTKGTYPEGNTVEYTYNENSPDRFQQSNMIRSVQTPDPARGGDQPKIEQVFVYEPIYNQLRLSIQARGSDIDHNGFTPPNADPVDRTIADPYDPTRRLNLRYAGIEFFDYQESREKAAQAPTSRKDIDGTGGQVNQSPLIAIDPAVLTTEVWLVQELGLTENASGLAELRQRLSRNLVKLGLGDLNGDGDTTPAISGNLVRTIVSSPVLIAGFNQHALETAIEAAGDLVNEALAAIDGGPAEGTQGGRLQTIVTMVQYNQFGQLTRTISPEGNVSTYEYFPETDPDGDTLDADPTAGAVTPPPADGRTLNPLTGGYLRDTVADELRNYFDQSGNDKSAATFNNNATNPAITQIRGRYTYDDVGNTVTMTDGRGIRTDYFVNEHDEVVQVTRAADISAASSANPGDPLIGDPLGPLTAFAYLSRTFYDLNGNVVLSQTEDRGNTSATDGNGLKFKDQGGMLVSIPIPAQAVLVTLPEIFA